MTSARMIRAGLGLAAAMVALCATGRGARAVVTEPNGLAALIPAPAA